MEGIIFDIKHFAVHDGPGIRQTVFFKGCPLSCWWCHNPESQKLKPQCYIQKNKVGEKVFEKEKSVGYPIRSHELLQIILEDSVFYEESNGGVTFSGGEPFMQFDFLDKMLELCDKEGIHKAIDTTGYTSLKKLSKAAETTNLFLYDLKIIDDSTHKLYTGVSAIPVLDNLKWLDQNKQNYIIRFPVIPTITDTDKNIKDIIDYISSLKNVKKIDILPFHNISKSKYERFNIPYKMKGIPGYDEETAEIIAKKFKSLGLKINIGG